MLIHHEENSKGPDRAYNQATEVFKTGLKLKASCQTFSILCSKRSKYLQKKASLFNQLWKKGTFIFYFLSFHIYAVFGKRATSSYIARKLQSYRNM